MKSVLHQVDAPLFFLINSNRFKSLSSKPMSFLFLDSFMPYKRKTTTICILFTRQGSSIKYQTHYRVDHLNKFTPMTFESTYNYIRNTRRYKYNSCVLRNYADLFVYLVKVTSMTSVSQEIKNRLVVSNPKFSLLFSHFSKSGSARLPIS